MTWINTNYIKNQFSKFLADRLHKLSDVIIGINQTGGIIGRRIKNNLCLMRNLIKDAKTRENN